MAPLWAWLTEAEEELWPGGITDEAITQMREHIRIQDEDFELVEAEEKRRRHDVMPHVHVFGQVAPRAAGVIHLGATSSYSNLFFIKTSLDLLLPKLATVIQKLYDFARQYKGLPCLGRTHGQPAQLSRQESVPLDPRFPHGPPQPQAREIRSPFP